MPTKPKAEAVVVEPTKDENQTQMDEKQTQMFGLLRHVSLAMIGAVVIVEEGIESALNHMIERGEIAEKQGKKMVHEAMDKSKVKSGQLDEQIKKDMESVLERINIPTKADVEDLSQKISDLSTKIDELKKPA
jgi:poly(hydroxyalkanoate) granule-associated protein